MSTAHTILATFDLSDTHERHLVESMQRMHGGKRALFRRMLDMHRSGTEITQIAQWSEGGFCVVRWSLANGAIAMQWHDHASERAAREAFAELIRS